MTSQLTYDAIRVDGPAPEAEVWAARIDAPTSGVVGLVDALMRHAPSG